jgi:hypothetical protein
MTVVRASKAHLDIRPGTATCGWNGQGADYDWIVAALQRRCPQLQQAKPAPTLHVERGSWDEEEENYDTETRRMLADQQLPYERSRRAS